MAVKMIPNFDRSEKKSHCKVILVEDNKAEADLTRLVYREQNLPVDIIHCQNGEEFLDLLKVVKLEEICYVLLDLNMPKLNGYDVLETLAKEEKWRGLVVIVFSSSSNEKDVIKCYDLGAKAYVSKPFDIGELDRVILSIHRFWGNLNIKPVLSDCEV